MPALLPRPWVPETAETRVQSIATTTASAGSGAIEDRVYGLIARNREIHERTCFNLNPATNVMNPKAEAALAAGLGARPSLGYPGQKYETGLDAIEEIEVIAQELAEAQNIDAVAAIGCVIRGETPHFDFVAGETARGLMQVTLESGVPIALGVTTTDTLAQAEARAGGAVGNKGSEAVYAVLHSAAVMRELANLE